MKWPVTKTGNKKAGEEKYGGRSHKTTRSKLGTQCEHKEGQTGTDSNTDLTNEGIRSWWRDTGKRAELTRLPKDNCGGAGEEQGNTGKETEH